MFLSPLFTTVTDHRSGTFFLGVLFLFLTPFVLKPLKLSERVHAFSIRNIVLGIFLSFLPVSILLMGLNYLEVIPTTKPSASWGPFLFAMSLSIFIKMVFNWKHLSRSIKSVVVFEMIVFFVFLCVCFIEIDFIRDRPFDIRYLFGSWAII